jgi:hypothetical protein
MEFNSGFKGLILNRCNLDFEVTESTEDMPVMPGRGLNTITAGL